MKKITAVLLISVFFISRNTVLASHDFLTPSDFGMRHGLKKMAQRRTKPFLASVDESFGPHKAIFTFGYGALSIASQIAAKPYRNKPGYSLSAIGPLYIKGEYGVTDEIGFVLCVNYNSWQARWTHTDSSLTTPLCEDMYKRSVTSILARINLHYDATEMIDPYWGIGIGYRMVNYSFSSTDPNYKISPTIPQNFGLESTVGFRCYVVPGFGFYIELGLTQSVIQGGLALNL